MADDLVFYATQTDADCNLVFGQLACADITQLYAPMMQTLQRMLGAKNGIKAAIESLGIDLTGVAFADYAEVIDMRVLQL